MKLPKISNYREGLLLGLIAGSILEEITVLVVILFVIFLFLETPKTQNKTETKP